MKALIDKLIPGSISDAMIMVVCIGAAYFLFTHFGELGLAALLGLGSQGNNKKRREAKEEKKRYNSEIDQAIDNINESNAASETIERKIVKVGETPFVDNEESNEKVVNNIRNSGL